MPDRTDQPLTSQRIEHDLLDTAAAGPAAIRGSLLRAVGYVVGIGLSVVSVSLLVRHLGVSNFGRYVTVISLITIVQGVTDAGLTSIGVREYAIRGPAERQRLMRNLVGVRLVLTVLGVLVATGFSAVAGYGRTLVVGSSVAGLGLILLVMQGTLSIPLVSALRLGWVTAMDLLRQVLFAASVIALVVVGADLLPFFAVTVPVSLAVLGCTALLVRGMTPMRPAFEPREWLLLVRGVLPVAAATAIGALYLRVTVILMSLVATEVETGYYATSYRVLEVIIAIPTLMVGATLPLLARAARDDHDRLRYALQRLFEVTLIVGTWFALCVFLGASFIIEVLAGGRSDPSVPVLQIQAIAIVANFVGASWLFALLSLHRHRELLGTAVFALILASSLTLGLEPRFQAQGAAIAVAIGEIALGLLALGFLVRARPDLRPSAAVVPPVVAAVVPALALGLIGSLTSLEQAVAASVVYFGVLLLLRAVPPEIADALRRRSRLA